MKIQQNDNIAFSKGKIIPSKKGRMFVTSTINSLMNIVPNGTELHIKEAAGHNNRWFVGFKTEQSDAFLTSKESHTSTLTQEFITNIITEGWNKLIKSHRT